VCARDGTRVGADGARGKRTRAVRIKPGTQWQYSNTGYAIVQAVIERVTNDSMIHLLIKEILAPLQLNETSSACPADRLATGYTAARRDPENAPSGAGVFCH
jgi:CubicO group peptidase (beta-lactamase class C family)